jgi:hypothetical protein
MAIAKGQAQDRANKTYRLCMEAGSWAHMTAEQRQQAPDPSRAVAQEPPLVMESV